MKLKLYLHLRHSEWNKEAPWAPVAFEMDMTDYGYVLVNTVEVDVPTPPERELRARLGTSLMAQARNIRAKAHKESIELEDKANRLLSLEYVPKDPA
jgi:hypothetical protein